MAESENVNASIHWYQPEPRAVIYPQALHVPRRLARFLKTKPFEIRWNDDFATVMAACGKNRDETWINQPLIDIYTEWHRQGGAYCLSVFEDEQRVGGIYGVHMGGVFMAESMFSTVPNASSVAVVVLTAGLNQAGVELIDVQFKNAHSAKFGITDITHHDYMMRLTALKDKAVVLKEDYFDLDVGISFTQSLSQTS